MALGSFVAHQWLKYQRKALRYQVAIKDSLYFRNVNNNAGVFDALVGAAEEQDFKEALLAYAFLRAAPDEEGALDARVEEWLLRTFKVDVDFEVDDGLAKLERYGLLKREGARLSVVPLGRGARRARSPLGRGLFLQCRGGGGGVKTPVTPGPGCLFGASR